MHALYCGQFTVLVLCLTHCFSLLSTRESLFLLVQFVIPVANYPLTDATSSNMNGQNKYELKESAVVSHQI